LINANRIDEAIEHLRKTVKLWKGGEASSWHAFRSKHLLGYAMLLSKVTPESEKIFIAGGEGMVKEQSHLNHPESANLIMSHVSKRTSRYFNAINLEESNRWGKLYSQYRSKLDDFEPLSIDLGRMKTRKTDHFIIASPFSSIGDYARIAEETWENLVHILPPLRNDFEKGDFITPYGKKAPKDQYGEDGQFRFLLVLPDKETMKPIMTGYLKSIRDAKRRDAAFSLASVFGFIEDKDGSSAEFVGEFGLRKISKCMK